jgi:hypothetical protein
MEHLLNVRYDYRYVETYRYMFIEGVMLNKNQTFKEKKEEDTIGRE